MTKNYAGMVPAFHKMQWLFNSKVLLGEALGCVNLQCDEEFIYITFISHILHNYNTLLLIHKSN